MLNDSKYSVYERKEHSGVWRQLVVRTCHNTKQVLVTLVIQGKELTPEYVKNIRETIKKTFQDQIEPIKEQFGFSFEGCLLQLFDGVNDSVPNNHPTDILFGKNYVVESMCGLEFRISASSFFQVNVPQAEELYKIASKWASVSDNVVLLDVCCGTGTIGLSLAKYVKHVVGLEIVPEAIED
eukprot:UN23976